MIDDNIAEMFIDQSCVYRQAIHIALWRCKEKEASPWPSSRFAHPFLYQLLAASL